MSQDWGKVQVKNGTATTTHTITDADGLGDFNLVATYDETDNYQSATASSSVSIRRPTEISVTNILANQSETVTLHADVTYGSGLLVDAGDVEFSIDGAIVGGAVTVNKGVAELEYTLPSSIETSATLTAVYKGTNAGNYYGASTSAAGTITIRGSTNVVVTDLSANRGETATITAEVTDKSGSAINEGTATLYIDGVTTGLTATVTGGSASFNYEVPTGTTSGSHTIQVQYAENDDYSAGSGDAILIVRNETSATVFDISGNPGQTITLSAQITGEDGSAVSSGSAVFTIDGSEEDAVTVAADGTASYSYTIPASATGSLEYSVRYVENVNYMACTSANATITIREDVVVQLDDISGLVGDVVSITGTVTTGSGSAVNEGYLAFTLEEVTE